MEEMKRIQQTKEIGNYVAEIQAQGRGWGVEASISASSSKS
jgi:hypothetical protein